MVKADTALDNVARLILQELELRPRRKTTALFAVTLRGHSYDAAIAALQHGLQVGLFREEEGRLIACPPPERRSEPPPDDHPTLPEI
jgi:hypothetical protein